MDPDEEDDFVEDDFQAEEPGGPTRIPNDDTHGGDRHRTTVHGLQFDPIDVMSDEPVAEPHEADFEVWSKDDPAGAEQFEDPEVAQRAGMAEQRTTRERRIREGLGGEPELGIQDIILPGTTHARRLGRAAAQTAMEGYDHPEALMGAYQGMMGNWGDEDGGLMAEAGAADPTYGLGVDGAMMLPLGFEQPSQDEVAEAGADATDYIRTTDQEAREAAPNAYGAAYAGGALAQTAAVPMPSTAGMPWYIRLLGGTLQGEAQGALAASGAADEGDRLTAAQEGAQVGGAWGLGGAVAGEGLQAAFRAPGAMRGAGESLGRHADRMRLSQSGVRGPGAIQAADRTFAEGGGFGSGRHALAEELRSRGHGEVAGIPMPGQSFEDTLELLNTAGPEIGNPLRGTEHMGDVERQLDAAGAHVDMNRVADEIIRRSAHEESIGAGGARDAVVDFAEQLRGRPRRVPLATERYDPEAQAYGAASGTPRYAEVPANPIVRFSAAHRQRQALQQREFPGVPQQYIDMADEVLSREMASAAQAADIQALETAGATIDLVRIADDVEQSMRTAGERPEAIAALVGPLREQGAVPLGQGRAVQSRLLRDIRARQLAARQAAGQVVGPDTAIPEGASPRVRAAAEARLARRAAERQVAEASQVPIPGRYVQAVQEAIDGQVQEALGSAGPGLADQWGDLNRTYSLGRFMLQHGRAADAAGSGGGMMIGEGQAMRDALAGDPRAIMRMEATRHGARLGRDIAGGLWTRGAEAGSRTMVNVADALQGMLGSNPERLGPYAQDIAREAARGPAQLAAWHYQQAMRDQAYRDWLAEQGLGGTGEDADTEPYDFLTQGLTAEDIYAAP